MNSHSPIRRPRRIRKPSEEGFTLLLVIFLVVALTIALAVAMPNIAKQIQRDREVETMHRGLQYKRAVKLYYAKFGAYPPNVDALVKGVNNIKFLRKKYTDPMTGKDDWKPILFGQNKAPIALGFFGQPLAGTAIAGVGPSGGNTQQNGSSLFPSSGTSGTNGTDGSTGTSGTNGSNGTTGATGTNGSGNTNGANGSNGSDSSSGSTDSSGFGSGSGQSFGGAGIIGFEPGSSKQSILVYKKKDHYNQWEFTYSPLEEQQMTMSGGASPVGDNGSGTPPTGSTPATGTPSPNTPGASSSPWSSSSF